MTRLPTHGRPTKSVILVVSISLDTFLRVRSYMDIPVFASSWLRDASEADTLPLALDDRPYGGAVMQVVRSAQGA